METLALFFLQFALVFIAIFILIYIVSSMTYMKLAKKAGVDMPWLAWIPYGQHYLSIKLAQIPVIEIIIPIVLILISAFATDRTLIFIVSTLLMGWFITVDRKILERFGKNKTLAFLHLLPGGSLIVLAVLASVAFTNTPYKGLENKEINL